MAVIKATRKILPNGREICRSKHAYQKRRKEILKRDDFPCVRCFSAFEVEIHHKTKRSVLRDNPIDNLIAERITGHQHNGGRQ